MMIYKVITIAFVTICAAEHQTLLPELLNIKKLALKLTQPFGSHAIVPMIVKWSEEYNAPSSYSRSIRSAYANTMFEKLQYAPLHKVMRDSTNPTPTPSSAPMEQTDSLRSKKNRQYSKSHLEPRTEATDKKSYAPDEPKEPSASRSPGHNAVYRIISERPVKEKPVNYDIPIGINLDLKSLTTTTAMPLIERSSDDKPLTLTNENLVLNPNSLETDMPEQDKSKRYSPHAKYHRLHLNIARVYSPGQVPPKPPAYVRAYPDHFIKLPNLQAYMPKAYPDHIKNTMLFPVKYHRNGNYRPHTSILHF